MTSWGEHTVGGRFEIGHQTKDQAFSDRRLTSGRLTGWMLAALNHTESDLDGSGGGQHTITGQGGTNQFKK